MKNPETEDLIAYLYDEADESTRQAVNERLDHCAETRDQLEKWRSTMHVLDQWVVEAPEAARCPVWWRRSVGHTLRLAALVTLLLGIGFLVGAQWRKPSSDSALAASFPEITPAAPETASESAFEKAVETRVAERLTEERALLAQRHDEIAKNLILASGSMTHRQVQDYVGQALEHLETHALRNETLAMFLAPKEREAYQRKSAALKSIAKRVDRESQRREQFTQQIIERARARQLRAH